WAALEEAKRMPPGLIKGRAESTSSAKSFSARNAPRFLDCEKVGGSSRRTSKRWSLRWSRRRQSKTSRKMNSWAAGSIWLRAKLRLPHSRYFLERSRLVVIAPARAAQTEKP